MIEFFRIHILSACWSTQQTMAMTKFRFDISWRLGNRLVYAPGTNMPAGSEVLWGSVWLC